MLVKTYGSALIGVDAIVITVEVHTDNGFKFFIVGLPDNAVKESQRRIEAAFKNVGFKMPGKKITVNLAPADIRKEGSAYDLSIAMAILASSGAVKSNQFMEYLMVGELSLDGSLQPLKGALSMASCAKAEGMKGIVLPQFNAQEAAFVDDLEIIGIDNLTQAIDFFNSGIKPHHPVLPNELARPKQMGYHDFKDVKGQYAIKRALEIAAAGGHNVVMIGPPGAGKTMLAKRLPGILPEMSLQEAIESTKIHSVAGLLDPKSGLLKERPFRSPHHTISDVALVGGGGNPQPGEISLAHNGILFLDELPEFKRSVLEVLRQPMEEGIVHISRAKVSVQYPSNFILLASMNPCPCGYHNHPERECTCGPQLVQRYKNKVSGPLMDRIDLHIDVTPVPFTDLSSKRDEESSDQVKGRVMKARKTQERRLQDYPCFHNAAMPKEAISKYCRLDAETTKLFKEAMERLNLSARAYDKILRVSRTIADLDDKENIESIHLSEAIQYRSLDREK